MRRRVAERLADGSGHDDGRAPRPARDVPEVRRPDRRIPRPDRPDPSARATSGRLGDRRPEPRGAGAMSDPARRGLPPVHAVLDWPGLAGDRRREGREADRPRRPRGDRRGPRRVLAGATARPSTSRALARRAWPIAGGGPAPAPPGHQRDGHPAQHRPRPGPAGRRGGRGGRPGRPGLLQPRIRPGAGRPRGAGPTASRPCCAG